MTCSHTTSPGIKVEIIREAQVKYQRRFDLLVKAPTLDRALATVVIEIKWSDNEETRSSLVEQLARKYLRDHGNSHGIYLVGWTGEWRSPEGVSRNLDELVRHLDEQVVALNGDSDLPAVAIRPIVLDMRWRDSPASDESKVPG